MFCFLDLLQPRTGSAKLPSSIGVNLPVLGSLRVDLQASVQKVRAAGG